MTQHFYKFILYTILSNKPHGYHELSAIWLSCNSSANGNCRVPALEWYYNLIQYIKILHRTDRWNSPWLAKVKGIVAVRFVYIISEIGQIFTQNWGPFHQRFFHHNSNLMEISLSSNLITGDHIAIKFDTCQDSPAVVPCDKFCSNRFITVWMRAKWNFHHIWIVMVKLLVKWSQSPNVTPSDIL